MTDQVMAMITDKDVQEAFRWAYFPADFMPRLSPIDERVLQVLQALRKAETECDTSQKVVGVFV